MPACQTLVMFLLSGADVQALLADAAGRAGGYLASLDERPVALAAARHHQMARAGWDVQADGLFGAPELTVVIGENAHSTLVRPWARWAWGMIRQETTMTASATAPTTKKPNGPGKTANTYAICSTCGATIPVTRPPVRVPRVAGTAWNRCLRVCV